VSAFSHTDWTVICDHPDCGRQLNGADLDSGPDSPTTADIRKILRRQGWQTSARAPDDGYGAKYNRRLDFCPDHKTAETKET
jgi:hypothetical protein